MIKIIDQNLRKTIRDLHNVTNIGGNDKIRHFLMEVRKNIVEKQDTAILEYTQKFDKIDPSTFQFKVTSEEVQNAYSNVPKAFISALKQAKHNIGTFHERQKPTSWTDTPSNGVERGVKHIPIPSVGLYVPGGRAPYPSTVLMDAIPAKIAGVEKIVMVTPPNPDGSIAPQILVAADICEISEIYKIGGGQAIFALAHGTETIPKVSKIVGPGNIYVSTAKQLTYGIVDIDKPAGPSEVLVYIDNIQYASYAAAEILAQLEHDPDAIAIGISESKKILDQINTEISTQLPNCGRKDIIEQSIQNTALLLSSSLDESIDLINDTASEHLVLLNDNAKTIQPKIQNAGAIFLGPYTPVALGDYYAGPNHVLPTGGSAKFASPLGVMDFMKFSTVLEYSKEALKDAQADIKELTDMEGFDAHQHAIDIRCQ